MMRDEEEIRDKLTLMREIELLIPPSQLLFTDWILEQGNENDQNIYFEILDGIADAERRRKEDRFSPKHPYCARECDNCSGGYHSSCLDPKKCHDVDDQKFWVDLD